MRPIDKAPWLASLEQRTEQHIREAIQSFQNLDEDTLLQPSPSGGWSIAQCLAHLTSYGRYYLPRLQQGLEQVVGKPATDTFVGSWLGAYMTKLMDPATGRRTYKAARQHQPPDPLSAHSVIAEFIDQQEELIRLLRAAENVNINSVRVPLSIAPWLRLPLGDILQFLVAHNERHIAQAKRNR